MSHDADVPGVYFRKLTLFCARLANIHITPKVWIGVSPFEKSGRAHGEFCLQKQGWACGQNKSMIRD